MKSHFVTIRFKLPYYYMGVRNLVFSGLVNGVERNGKLVVSVDKIFQTAFGFPIPPRTIIYH